VSDLLDLWWGGLTFDAAAFVQVTESREARLLAYVLVLLAGVSQLIGQSVILFLNDVRPWRFVIALALNAITFAIEVGVWVVSFLVVERILGGEFPLTDVAGIVALGHAAYLLAFLLLLPYYGPPLQRVIEIWTVVAIGVGIAAVTSLDVAAIAVIVSLGYGFRLLIKVSVGRWIVGVDRWLWRTATGQRFRVRVEDGLSTMSERATSDARRWFGR
jgi:hypothetical protein